MTIRRNQPPSGHVIVRKHDAQHSYELHCNGFTLVKRLDGPTLTYPTALACCTDCAKKDV